MYANKHAEEIVEEIAKVFNKEDFDVHAIYGGGSISVTGNKDNTYVYFRVYNNGDRCNIDISNIQISKDRQRQGYFTALVGKLIDLECIEAVIVSSVITEEMHKACRKNNFEKCEMYNGYIKTHYNLEGI